MTPGPGDAAPVAEENTPDRPSGEGEAVAHQSGPQTATHAADAIKPADAIPDYPNLKVRAMIETGVYEVLHLKGGGGSKSYRVNLKDMTCTCPDWEFNRDTHQPCKHMSAALLDGAPQQFDVNQAVLSQIAMYDARIERAVSQLERAATAQEAEAAAAQTGGSASGTASAGASGPDPEEAASRLQDAYDGVLDDMQVQATDTLVWVQTGQDTPDTLPGPGNVEVFDALLRNPDQTEFVPDDYNGDLPNALDEKPGEWWKNALAPEDVDEYISEVLE